MIKHQHQHHHHDLHRSEEATRPEAFLLLAIKVLLLVDLIVVAARVSLTLHPCETKRDVCAARSVLTVLGIAQPAIVSSNLYPRPDPER